MNRSLYSQYINILKEELIPAFGCTEPIAIAFTAASAAACMREYLGDVLPEKVCVNASGNIIKNVKSVIVPNTGGLKGIEAAAAAGIICGDASKELEVLSGACPDDHAGISSFIENTDITVTEAESSHVLYIEIELFCTDKEGIVHNIRALTVDKHTGLCLIAFDGEAELENSIEQETASDRSILSIDRIIDFADNADIPDVKDILDCQIAYNTAIAEEGLSGRYGAAIGRTLLMSYGDNVFTRAKAWAAAGSDARMAGCELPVVINSGSGNQGMTASLPVIIYARELKVSDELLYRALLVSNLTTIHLKSGIGCLSAYCGATSAGCGAGAGIMYLHGGRFREIAHTVVNALAINSGVVCDGAKASCAAKIASAVESGLLGMQMYMHGKEFYGGDGIVSKGVENTIRNVGDLAKNGMAQTDREIIRIMLDN